MVRFNDSQAFEMSYSPHVRQEHRQELFLCGYDPKSIFFFSFFFSFSVRVA